MWLTIFHKLTIWHYVVTFRYWLTFLICITVVLAIFTFFYIFIYVYIITFFICVLCFVSCFFKAFLKVFLFFFATKRNNHYIWFISVVTLFGVRQIRNCFAYTQKIVCCVSFCKKSIFWVFKMMCFKNFQYLFQCIR